MTDNKPAFPCDNIVERNEKGQLQGYEISSSGMTLLDYLAAKAMQSYIVKGNLDKCLVVSLSYDIANLMLKERKKYDNHK